MCFVLLGSCGLLDFKAVRLLEGCFFLFGGLDHSYLIFFEWIPLYFLPFSYFVSGAEKIESFVGFPFARGERF